MPKVAPKARTALLIFLIGVCLTFASLRYVQPANCNQMCVQQPCSSGTCKLGEQTAGFPFPFVRDQESNFGSSPPQGWGRVGFEDYLDPDIKAFSFNILFYSAIVWSLIILGKRLRTRL
jgi:hypothetical protein